MILHTDAITFQYISIAIQCLVEMFTLIVMLVLYLNDRDFFERH